jgi:RND family efflux transporter MFP subunit
MSHTRRTLTAFTVLIVLGALGAGIWWRLRDGGEEATDAAVSAADSLGLDLGPAGQEFATDIPEPVRGAPAVRDTLWLEVSTQGRAAAVRQARVAALAEGVVQAVPVVENRRVSTGELLLQIDTTDLSLALARARAELANARAEFERLTLFLDEEPDPDVRERRRRAARVSSGLEGAEVALRQEELRMERATVRAPFEGRIANLDVVPGQYVSGGTELLTVVDLDPIKVEVNVLEAELGYLVEGRRAEVSFAAFPDETFTGRIETINPVVDVENRTGRVTVLLDNPGGRIKPGMSADVQINARALPDRILVPREAVLARGETQDRPIVFVYEGDEDRGRAQWRYVTPGQSNDEWVELLPGDEGIVEPGEIVLVDGHHYLAHDKLVTLVDRPAASGGRPR